MSEHRSQEPIQQMPEHASFFSRGLSRQVNEACDAFFEKRGQKKMTLQELKDRMFRESRRPQSNKNP